MLVILIGIVLAAGGTAPILFVAQRRTGTAAPALDSDERLRILREARRRTQHAR